MMSISLSELRKGIKAKEAQQKPVAPPSTISLAALKTVSQAETKKLHSRRQLSEEKESGGKKAITLEQLKSHPLSLSKTKQSAAALEDKINQNRDLVVAPKAPITSIIKQKCETLNADAESEEDKAFREEYSVYFKMAKLGIPVSNIEQKLVMDQVDRGIMEKILSKLGGSVSSNFFNDEVKQARELSRIKLQRLHWKPIDKSNLTASSLWSSVASAPIKSVPNEEADGSQPEEDQSSKDLNATLDDHELGEVEFFFGVEAGNLSRKSNDKSSSKLHMPKVLDVQRAMNVAISLSSFKGVSQMRYVLNGVCSLNNLGNTLTLDNLLNLTSMLPTLQEAKALQSVSTSNKGELFCKLAIEYYPHLSGRLSCFLTLTSFDEMYQSVVPKLRLFIKAIDAILNSSNLALIFTKILAIGNALNTGTAIGDAVGFSLDSLRRTMSLKGGKDKKTSVLDLSIKILQEKGFWDILDVVHDIEDVEDACKLSPDNIFSELDAFNEEYSEMKDELRNAQNYLIFYYQGAVDSWLKSISPDSSDGIKEEDMVKCPFGPGIVKGVCPNGIFKVRPSKWNLINEVEHMMYVHESQLKIRAPFVKGDEVVTRHGVGTVEEIRAHDCVAVVRPTTWGSSASSTPSLFEPIVSLRHQQKQSSSHIMSESDMPTLTQRFIESLRKFLRSSNKKRKEINILQDSLRHKVVELSNYFGEKIYDDGTSYISEVFEVLKSMRQALTKKHNIKSKRVHTAEKMGCEAEPAGDSNAVTNTVPEHSKFIRSNKKEKKASLSSKHIFQRPLLHVRRRVPSFRSNHFGSSRRLNLVERAMAEFKSSPLSLPLDPVSVKPKKVAYVSLDSSDSSDSSDVSSESDSSCSQTSEDSNEDSSSSERSGSISGTSGSSNSSSSSGGDNSSGSSRHKGRCRGSSSNSDTDTDSDSDTDSSGSNLDRIIIASSYNRRGYGNGFTEGIKSCSYKGTDSNSDGSESGGDSDSDSGSSSSSSSNSGIMLSKYSRAGKANGHREASKTRLAEAMHSHSKRCNGDVNLSDKRDKRNIVEKKDKFQKIKAFSPHRQERSGIPNASDGMSQVHSIQQNFKPAAQQIENEKKQKKKEKKKSRKSRIRPYHASPVSNGNAFTSGVTPMENQALSRYCVIKPDSDSDSSDDPDEEDNNAGGSNYSNNNNNYSSPKEINRDKFLSIKELDALYLPEWNFALPSQSSSVAFSVSTPSHRYKRKLDNGLVSSRDIDEIRSRRDQYGEDCLTSFEIEALEVFERNIVSQTYPTFKGIDFENDIEKILNRKEWYGEDVLTSTELEALEFYGADILSSFERVPVERSSSPNASNGGSESKDLSNSIHRLLQKNAMRQDTECNGLMTENNRAQDLLKLIGSIQHPLDDVGDDCNGDDDLSDDEDSSVISELQSPEMHNLQSIQARTKGILSHLQDKNMNDVGSDAGQSVLSSNGNFTSDSSSGVASFPHDNQLENSVCSANQITNSISDLLKSLNANFSHPRLEQFENWSPPDEETSILLESIHTRISAEIAMKSWDSKLAPSSDDVAREEEAHSVLNRMEHERYLQVQEILQRLDQEEEKRQNRVNNNNDNGGEEEDEDYSMEEENDRALCSSPKLSSEIKEFLSTLNREASDFCTSLTEFSKEISEESDIEGKQAAELILKRLELERDKELNQVIDRIKEMIDPSSASDSTFIDQRSDHEDHDDDRDDVTDCDPQKSFEEDNVTAGPEVKPEVDSVHHLESWKSTLPVVSQEFHGEDINEVDHEAPSVECDESNYSDFLQSTMAEDQSSHEEVLQTCPGLDESIDEDVVKNESDNRTPEECDMITVHQENHQDSAERIQFASVSISDSESDDESMVSNQDATSEILQDTPNVFQST